MTTITDIVDAIATDLAGYAPTPGYLDWRHAHPDLLQAASAPWLAVWSPNTGHELLGTETEYDDTHTVNVEWAVSIADQPELGGSGLPAIVRQAILDLAPIEAQLRTYAAGVPGFGNQITGVLAATARDQTEGIVWRQTATLRIEQLP